MAVIRDVMPAFKLLQPTSAARPRKFAANVGRLASGLILRRNDLFFRMRFPRHGDPPRFPSSRASTANLSLVAPDAAFGFCLSSPRLSRSAA